MIRSGSRSLVAPDWAVSRLDATEFDRLRQQGHYDHGQQQDEEDAPVSLVTTTATNESSPEPPNSIAECLPRRERRMDFPLC